MSCHLFSCYFCPFRTVQWHLASWLTAWALESDRSGFESSLQTPWQCDHRWIKQRNFGHVGYDRYFPESVLASIFFLCVWVYTYNIYNIFVLLLLLPIISWKSFLISPYKSPSIFLMAVQYHEIWSCRPLLSSVLISGCLSCF